jgi:hypothetical protein
MGTMQSMDTNGEHTEPLFDAVQRYRAEHPEVDEALRILAISEEAYRISIAALTPQRDMVASGVNELICQH